MDIQRFWVLIGLVDGSALDSGDEEGALKKLQWALSGLPVAELESFEENLSQVLFSIDGESYAAHAGDSGKSADGFLYSRCYVVARGQAFFLTVLSDPSRMPTSIEQWCELLLYVHRKAWADLTGKDQSEWGFDASVSYETGSNRALW